MTLGWDSSSSASWRPAVTMLNTPGGRPASARSAAMRLEVCGTRLAALRTKVLPVVIASGVIQPIGIMAGKFHGAMPTNTPIGSR